MTDKKLTLSQAYHELEKITEKFENNEVDLEKGIPLFKRGLELGKFIKEQLAVMENQIEKISKDFTELKKNSMDTSMEDVELESEELDQEE
jgi:exodeoxyribonuclease VII small subunit